MCAVLPVGTFSAQHCLWSLPGNLVKELLLCGLKGLLPSVWFRIQLQCWPLTRLRVAVGAGHYLSWSPRGPQGLEQCLAQSGHATDIPVDYHKESMVPFPQARDKFRAESVRTFPDSDIQMLRESLSLLGLLS